MSIQHVISASELLYRDITLELSDQSVKKYDGEDKTLAELDEWRVEQLPKIIADRLEREGTPWLTKNELVLLMDWKLAKGKFRATLPKLIRSNDEEMIIDTTKKGFGTLFEYFDTLDNSPDWSCNDTRMKYVQCIKLVYKQFCELRGVGPATASLIASLATIVKPSYAPPFFSDESFEYYVIEAQRPGTKIKYTIKEYCEELLPVYFDIMAHHKVDMSTLERGGWGLTMYEKNRFTSLTNVKVSFDLHEGQLARFTTSDKKHILEDELKLVGQRASSKRQRT